MTSSYSPLSKMLKGLGLGLTFPPWSIDASKLTANSSWQPQKIKHFRDAQLVYYHKLKNISKTYGIKVQSRWARLQQSPKNSL